jgi:hypothetical protein
MSDRGLSCSSAAASIRAPGPIGARKKLPVKPPAFSRRPCRWPRSSEKHALRTQRPQLPMQSSVIRVLTRLALLLAGYGHALAQPACRPTMAFTEPHYSAMTLPTLERTWTLAFTVDASPCAMSSGTLSVVYTVWRENGPDFGVVQTFDWHSDLNVISKKFWADESVGAYRVDVELCQCRN